MRHRSDSAAVSDCMPRNCCCLQAGLYTCLLPSLFFTYLGQAAYLINHPAEVSSVYYNSLPDPFYWPMFVVATLAAIVASQVGLPTPHVKVRMYLVYLKYWTLKLMPLMVYPKALFHPNFSIKVSNRVPSAHRLKRITKCCTGFV